MDPRYSIRAARAGDIPALGSIEQAATELLRGREALPDPTEASYESELRDAQEAGRLWVALDGDTPVGFALVELLASDLPHLEEVDVHPEHARRGVGARLVQAVCDWAARSGFAQLTLTTYRAVPFNRPFYARLGFAELVADRMRPELAARVRDETARGFDPERRVVMELDVRAAARAARVRLRPTTPADLDFVLALERHSENAPFVGQWSREEHASAIARADREHWIIERAPLAQPAGFIITYDLVARGFGAYVKRIVVADKSRGLGREALAEFLHHATRDLAAPHVWLVVAADNTRAQRAYAALGFRVASLCEDERRAHAEAAGGFSEQRLVMRRMLEPVRARA